jgi:hypothetical protein
MASMTLSALETKWTPLVPTHCTVETMVFSLLELRGAVGKASLAGLPAHSTPVDLEPVARLWEPAGESADLSLLATL